MSGSLNPLRLTGTALPAPLLLAAKLVALTWLIRWGLQSMSETFFVPFVPSLLRLGPPELLHLALRLTFAAAALLLFFNRGVRAACLALGVTLLVGIASSQLFFHHHRLFMALFFVLAGLYHPRLGSAPLRAQIAVMYFSAALNKLLEQDWRTGAFVEAWLPHYVAAYPQLAALLPPLWLSALLGWGAILLEFALVVLVLVPRLVPAAIVVGFAYHTLLVVLTLGHVFGHFWFAMAGAYLALMQWPEGVRAHYTPEVRWQARVQRWLARVDFDGRLRWQPQAAGPLRVEQEGRAALTGVTALVRLLLYCPAVYLLVAVGGACVTELTPLLLLPLGIAVYGALRRPARAPVLASRVESAR